MVYEDVLVGVVETQLSHHGDGVASFGVFLGDHGAGCAVFEGFDECFRRFEDCCEELSVETSGE